MNIACFCSQAKSRFKSVYASMFVDVGRCGKVTRKDEEVLRQEGRKQGQVMNHTCAENTRGEERGRQKEWDANRNKV